MEPDNNMIDMIDEPPINKWRKQHRRSKNMLKDFGSCEDKMYPTVDLTCTDYSECLPVLK